MQNVFIHAIFKTGDNYITGIQGWGDSLMADDESLWNQ